MNHKLQVCIQLNLTQKYEYVFVLFEFLFIFVFFNDRENPAFKIESKQLV